jgi:hypothetical protein
MTEDGWQVSSVERYIKTLLSISRILKGTFPGNEVMQIYGCDLNTFMVRQKHNIDSKAAEGDLRSGYISVEWNQNPPTPFVPQVTASFLLHPSSPPYALPPPA